MFDSTNSCSPTLCSLYWQHDTTDFFYRPQSSKMMTDIDGSVALHERRCRTNLKNAELSKRTFRIFLEKQILSHVGLEIRKNINEVQTPLTPVFDYNEGGLTSNDVQLVFQSSQTAVFGKKSPLKNYLNLPNLEAEAYPIDKTARITNVSVNHDTDSEVNVYEDFSQCKSKATCTVSASNQNTSDLEINKVTNTESSHILTHDNSTEWFQDNETASVNGSLLSETISDTSMYNINTRRSNINHKRCSWRRTLFCCVN